MRCSTLAYLAAAGLATSALGDELWRQDPVNSFGGLSSQDARNVGGLGWFSEVVDNATLQAGATVNQIEFWGGYADPNPGNTHGFMIRFYADNAGAVGPLLFTQDATSFTETVYYVHPTLGWPGYRTVANLSPGLAVPSTGSYWVAVVAILDRGGTSAEPQWGWVQAQSLTPPPCKQRFFSPTFVVQNQDVAFVLNGTTGSGGGCYANCDNSTVAPILNVNDFVCFNNKFAAGDTSANCDGSTTPPTLNVNDFVCFNNAFAAGCT